MSYWDTDESVQGTRRENLSDLEKAKNQYDVVGHRRLESIKQGGSPSALFSPWLALQQAYANQRMQMAERALPGVDAGTIVTPQAHQRDAQWEQAVRDAQSQAVQNLLANK